MNRYETIVIIDDKINKEERNNVLEKIKTFIKNNGEIEEINDIGMRKLAYKIQKHEYGYYFQILFKANSEMIVELERIYRITDEILKFITVRQ